MEIPDLRLTIYMIAQKKKDVNLFEVTIINGEAADNPEARLAIEVEQNNIIRARP